LIDFTKQLSEAPTGQADVVVKSENNFKVEKAKFNYEGLF